MRYHQYIGTLRSDITNFIGGVYLDSFPFLYGWPGVRLKIFSEGIWIGPSISIFRPFVPVRTIRFDDLAVAQAVGSFYLFRGILFISRSSGKRTMFATRFKHAEILGTLGQFITNLNTNPIRFTPFSW